MVASDVTLVTVIAAAAAAPAGVDTLVVVWVGEVFGFVVGAWGVALVLGFEVTSWGVRVALGFAGVGFISLVGEAVGTVAGVCGDACWYFVLRTPGAVTCWKRGSKIHEPATRQSPDPKLEGIIRALLTKLEQTRREHRCFFLPGPPNFGLSLQ